MTYYVIKNILTVETGRVWHDTSIKLNLAHNPYCIFIEFIYIGIVTGYRYLNNSLRKVKLLLLYYKVFNVCVLV